MSTTPKPTLRGKVALITGASQGIGLAIAHALHAEGCEVIITARQQQSLDHALQRFSNHDHVIPLSCDIRDPEAVSAFFAEIKNRFQQLDILINNAGIGHSNLSVAELPFQQWKEVIDTNLHGMFLVTQAALHLMKRGGVIVNNLSIAAKRVFAGSSAYNASKHAGLGLTNTLREELRPQDIRVIALLPGATDTQIWETLWPDAPREKMMSADTVAIAVINALLTPDDGTVEELVVLPSAGTL